MEEFDFLVLGGGSGGCAAAGRLTEDPKTSVAVFEAGGDGKSWMIWMPIGGFLTLPRKLQNWAYETIPQKGLNGRKGYQPRGKALGGSSTINAQVYIRGNRWDYDHWAELGNTGWSYADVLPYFKRSENNEDFVNEYHGRGGPLNVASSRNDSPLEDMFLNAVREAQLPLNDDFNGAHQEGCGKYQVTQINGERCSAARAYIHPNLSKRPNLFVQTGTTILRILFEGKRAVGAEVAVGGVKKIYRARREVILSAGAFGSPQILMLSGVGNAEALKRLGIACVHHAPQVGQNLQDHPDFTFGYKTHTADPFGFSIKGLAKGGIDIGKYWRMRRGMLSSNFAQWGGFLKTKQDLATPDIQLHFVVGLVDDHARKLHWGHGFTCHVCILRPKSRGSVQLASANPYESPQIDPNFFDNEDDLQTMIDGFKLTRRIMDAPSLKAIRKSDVFTEGVETDAQIRDTLRNRADTVYHPVGTCAMGADPARAVVDPQLRVYGLEGLRVVDASIMPTLIGGNTNAPSMMIGEKASDMIKASITR